MAGRQTWCKPRLLVFSWREHGDSTDTPRSGPRESLAQKPLSVGEHCSTERGLGLWQ